MVIFIPQQILRTFTIDQTVVVYGLECAMPDTLTRHCAGAPAHNTTTFYESVAALRNGRHARKTRAVNSTIDVKDHRDDVGQPIAPDDLPLDDANLLQLHAS